ncbi:hypothetical protein MRB53_010739 [Persea americana]|uniref:Uncharacterized protein n=1 Tax=Persea americana TaxID=3435 RepID=A0ACC2LSU4_PERAE|nr:hypothetical protein MRB53_010739 [Persea americana]
MLAGTLCNKVWNRMQSSFLKYQSALSLLFTLRMRARTLNPAWLAGESQGVDDPNLIDINESLSCNEILDSFPPFDELGLEHIPYF